MIYRTRAFFLALICIVCFAMPTPVEGGVFSSSVERVLARKAVQRAAVKRAEAKKAVRQFDEGKINEQAKNKAIKSWDKARDKTIPVKSMEQSRIVNRYTNKKQAKIEQAYGISPYTHMTSKAVGPGRTISRSTAKGRYGLGKEPQVRMKVEIPKGQPVRKAKVIAGRPGYGEITSTKRIPSKNIIEVHPMP